MTNLETASNRSTTATNRRATKTANGEGDAYWFYGDLAILRSPEGALPIIIEHHVSPGGAAPLHVHLDVDDSFLLLSGTLAIRSEDQTFLAFEGDYVSLPQGVPHTLRVVGDEEAVMLQTHAASSFLDFIKAVGVPATEPKPDMATLDFAAMNNVAGETGQPVVGPPMSAEEALAIAAATR
jgi:mannose-6-phosphate isomerase-like protein (cupin superfamily)